MRESRIGFRLLIRMVKKQKSGFLPGSREPALYGVSYNVPPADGYRISNCLNTLTSFSMASSTCSLVWLAISAKRTKVS